jgi:soluble lytic murein transglycosylase-like protein
MQTLCKSPLIQSLSNTPPAIPKVNPNGMSYLFVLALITTLYCFTGAAVAGTIFVYELANGSRLITDSDQADSGYRLVRRYSTEPFSKRKVGASYTSNVILSKFDELILETADAHKLDPALLKAVIHVESAFNPFAVSRTGAMGLMQMMPGTAAQYNLIANQFDPQRNVYAGAHHLKDLLEQFDGNIRFALAGYNAGANAVNKYNGIPPHDETQRYVLKVMKLYSDYLKLNLNWSFSEKGEVKLIR